MNNFNPPVPSKEILNSCIVVPYIDKIIQQLDNGLRIRIAPKLFDVQLP
ncbi:hypothetical protein A2U01_0070312, partial [Trifolium medium]|nr:hypothetical protein [Trifolium medium]